MALPGPRPAAKKGTPSEGNPNFAQPSESKGGGKSSDLHPLTESKLSEDSGAFKSLPKSVQERISSERKSLQRKAVKESLTPEERKRLITSGGEPVIIDGQYFLDPEPEEETQRQRYLRAAAATKERILSGKERPAESASRIARVSGSEKFKELAERRRQELLAKAGKEAELAQVPQTYVKTGKDVGVISAQVYGKKREKEKQKFKPITIDKKPEGKFVDMTEYPYGKYEKKSISQFKEEQKLIGFEKRVAAGALLLKDVEKLRQEGIKYGDTTLVPLTPGLKRIETLSSVVTGGMGMPLEERGTVGGIAQGTVQALIGAPYYGIQFVTYAPEILSKSILSTEALIRPDTRKYAFIEGIRAQKEATSIVIDFVTSPGGIGFLLGAGASAAVSQISKPPKLIQYENIKYRTKTEGGVKVTEIGVKTKAGSSPKMFEYVSPSGTAKLKLGLVPADYASTGTLPMATSTSNIVIRTTGIKVFGKSIPIISLRTEKITTTIPDFDVYVKKQGEQKLGPKVNAYEIEGLTDMQKYHIDTAQSELDWGDINEAQYEKKIQKILKGAKGVKLPTTTTTKKMVYGGKAKGRKAEIILGKGKPKVQSKLPELKSAIPPPKTGVGTEVIQNIFELTQQEKIRISSAQEQIQLLKGEKGLTVKEAIFNIKQFKNKAGSSRVIEKFAAKRGGVFFGSATMQQLPEGFRLNPGDVDIYFPSKTESALSKRLIPKLQKKLIEVGEDVTIGKDMLSLEIRGEKVLEVKAGKGEITGEVAPEAGLGFDVDSKITVPFGKRTLSIKGLPKAKATKAGEQLKRKGIAATYFRPADVKGEAPPEFAEAGVLPRVKRTKDLPGFIVQSRGLIELRKTGMEEFNVKPSSVQKREIETEQATKALERYIDTFTPEQQKAIVKIIDENAPAKAKEIQFELVSEKAKTELKGVEPGDVLISPSTISKMPFKTKIIVEKKKEKSPTIKSRSIVTQAYPKYETPKIIISPATSPTKKSPGIIASLKITSPSRPDKSPGTRYTPPSPVISPSPSPSPYPSPSPSPSPYIFTPEKTTTTMPSGFYGSTKKPSTFSVLVRRRGVFRKIATVGSERRAFALGMARVKGTAAASFKIEGLRENVRARTLLPKEFRISKKEPGVFVQKRQFRISSAGEKGEITAKGLFAIKQKRRKEKYKSPFTIGGKSRFNIFG